MSFGIGIRKDDRDLLQQVNSALNSLKQDGTLRKIYADWGIYNAGNGAGIRRPGTGQATIKRHDIRNTSIRSGPSTRSSNGCSSTDNTCLF